MERRKSKHKNIEPCQISKMECFAKCRQSLKVFNFFIKHSNLDVRQGSEYAFVICYSLFEKIDDANKIDSVAI